MASGVTVSVTIYHVVMDFGIMSMMRAGQSAKCSISHGPAASAQEGRRKEGKDVSIPTGAESC